MHTFVKSDEPQWMEAGNGVRRKIRAYNEGMMLVEIGFEEGAPLVDHSHPHTQISYVLEGEFHYHIEGDMHLMKKGDSILVESGKVHGGTCIKAGTLLDIFTPMREDFIR